MYFFLVLYTEVYSLSVCLCVGFMSNDQTHYSDGGGKKTCLVFSLCLCVCVLVSLSQSSFILGNSTSCTVTIIVFNTKGF